MGVNPDMIGGLLLFLAMAAFFVLGIVRAVRGPGHGDGLGRTLANMFRVGLLPPDTRPPGDWAVGDDPRSSPSGGVGVPAPRGRPYRSRRRPRP